MAAASEKLQVNAFVDVKDKLGYNATFSKKLFEDIIHGVTHDNEIWLNIVEYSRTSLVLSNKKNAIAAPRSSKIYQDINPSQSYSEHIQRQQTRLTAIESKLFSSEPYKVEAALGVIRQNNKFALILPTLCEFITNLLTKALVKSDVEKMYLALRVAEILLSDHKPNLDLVPLLACVSRCCFAKELVKAGELATAGESTLKPGELATGESTLKVRELASNLIYSFVTHYDNKEIKFNCMLIETIFAGIKAGNARLGTLYGWLLYLMRDEILHKYFEEIIPLLPELKNCAEQPSDEPNVKQKVDKSLASLETTLKAYQKKNWLIEM